MLERNADICRRYRRGDKVIDIAAAHGLHKWTVRRIARAGGCTIRDNGRPRKYE